MEKDARKTLLFIEERLRGTLPGLSAQLVMAPFPRPGDQTYLDVGERCHKAGVLLLLYPRQEQLYFLLTKRTDKVFHHRGQVSLPGGEQLPSETPVQAALRETEEELGTSMPGGEILGLLTPLYIPPSNYCIYPVVASIPHPPECRPRSEEVAEVIEVSLAHLLDPPRALREIRTMGGKAVEVPFYAFGGHRVWGATAMVLAEFAGLFMRRGRKRN
ncbi:MAG: hypothetical protein A2Y86_02465 [Candidatus Aminicenantes bacterium RBG_13_62_12]|nr:MAG: hypothetical protein A2Y86_02465 [Candidatus Aminicenantes bacterium RBG_13_62_12]